VIDRHEQMAAKLMLFRVFRKLEQIFSLTRPENNSFDVRADGDSICKICGQPYWNHAVEPRARWITTLCDMRRVKL
jgi:hypothetical protein